MLISEEEAHIRKTRKGKRENPIGYFRVKRGNEGEGSRNDF
jgi:hypothetical protein